MHFPRAFSFIAQVFSTVPHPLFQASTYHQARLTPELLVEPEEHWKSGGGARNPARLQAVGKATSHRLHRAGSSCSLKPPLELGRRGSWQGPRQFGWIPGGFTHLPPRSSPGYNVRRCQNVLIPSPNFRLNQNLDIRRRTQECDQPGVGTLLPQFSSLLPCMHSKPSNSVVRETLGNCA